MVVVLTIWWQQSEVDPSCLEALPQRATSLISVFYGLNIRPYLAPGPLGANFRQRYHLLLSLFIIRVCSDVKANETR